MSTDLTEFLGILDRWGVPYSRARSGRPGLHDDATWQYVEIHQDDRMALDYQPSEHPVVDGYTGFYTRFTFTAEGRFVSVGVWE